MRRGPELLAPGAPLYARALPRDAALPPAVSALHVTTGRSRAAGTMTVVRGATLPARLLGLALRLPRAGELPVVLVIARSDREECWSRWFGDDPPVRSTQQLGGDGRVVESWGPVELELTAGAADGALVLTGRSARLRLGRRCLRVPQRLAPHVDAHVADALGSPGSSVVVQVTVRLPGVGLLLGYSGELAVDRD